MKSPPFCIGFVLWLKLATWQSQLCDRPPIQDWDTYFQQCLLTFYSIIKSNITLCLTHAFTNFKHDFSDSKNSRSAAPWTLYKQTATNTRPLLLLDNPPCFGWCSQWQHCSFYIVLNNWYYRHNLANCGCKNVVTYNFSPRCMRPQEVSKADGRKHTEHVLQRQLHFNQWRYNSYRWNLTQASAMYHH